MKKFKDELRESRKIQRRMDKLKGTNMYSFEIAIRQILKNQISIMLEMRE